MRIEYFGLDNSKHFKISQSPNNNAGILNFVQSLETNFFSRECVLLAAEPSPQLQPANRQMFGVKPTAQILRFGPNTLFD